MTAMPDCFHRGNLEVRQSITNSLWRNHNIQTDIAFIMDWKPCKGFKYKHIAATTTGKAVVDTYLLVDICLSVDTCSATDTYSVAYTYSIVGIIVVVEVVVVIVVVVVVVVVAVVAVVIAPAVAMS